MNSITIFEIGGSEIEELTPQLRWVPRSMIQSDLILQQAWRINVRDNNGKTVGGRYEWRDVPTTNEPR